MTEDPHIVWVEKDDDIMERYREAWWKMRIHGWCYLAMKSEHESTLDAEN